MNRPLQNGMGMPVLNIVISSVGLVALVLGGWVFISSSGDAVLFGIFIAVPLVTGGATVAALPVLFSRRTPPWALVVSAWIILAIGVLFFLGIIALLCISNLG